MLNCRTSHWFDTLISLGRSIATLVIMASFLTWAGCSGGDSSEESAPADDAAAGAADPAADMAAEAMAAAEPQSEEEPEPPPAGEAPFDTTYLSVDTELFVHADVSKVLESSLVQTLAPGGQWLDKLEQQLGIPPRDIATMTVGVSDLEGLAKKSASSLPMMSPPGGMPMGNNAGYGPAGRPRSGPGGISSQQMNEQMQMEAEMAEMAETEAVDPAMMADMPSGDLSVAGGGEMASPKAKKMPDDQQPVVVVRTKGPFDIANLERPGAKRIPHGDKAFYEIQPPAQARPKPDPVYLYVPDSNTLIVAGQATIRNIIDQGEKRARPTADLGFVKTLPDVLLAVVPKDKAALMKQGQDLMLPGMGMPPVGGSAQMSGPNGYTPPAVQNPSSRGSSSGSSSSGSSSSGSNSSGSSSSGDSSGSSSGGNSSGSSSSSSSSGGDPSGTSSAGGSSGSDSSGGSSVPAAAPAGPQTTDQLFSEHVTAVAVLVNLSQGIQLDVAVNCDSPEVAQQIQAQVSQGMQEAQAAFEEQKKSLPGVLRHVGQPLVDSLTATASESVVTMSTALPEEEQPKLVMVPTALMGMMMAGMGMSGEGLDMGPGPGELAQEAIDDGQAAANGDQLPEGLQLKAITRWGQSRYGDQAPDPLSIIVVATGGPAADAVGYGKLKVTEAKGPGDTSLKWIGASSRSLLHDPLTGFVPITREGVFPEHPDDSVATGFSIWPPATPTDTLSSIEGEIVLSVAASTEDVQIADVGKLSGRRIDDDRLSAGNFQVEVREAGGVSELQVSFNEAPTIGRIEPVGPDGTPIPTVGSGSFSMESRKTLTFTFPGPLPPDAGLQVTVYSDLQEVPVPFRFENLPMPEPQELTPQQQALLVWTPAEPPGKEELVIEAQGRWRKLEPVELEMPAGGGFPGSGGPGDFGAAGFDIGEFSAEAGGAATDLTMEQQMEAAEQYSGAPPEAGAASAGTGASRRSGRPRGPTSDNPLRIVVDLIGPLAMSADALGEVEVTSVKTDLDTDLAYEGAEFGESDASEDYVEIDRDNSLDQEHPPGGVRLVLKLTPPNQPITALAQLNATLKLRTVRERNVAVLTDLQERVGKPEDGQLAAKAVSDRQLLKVGLKPMVALDTNRVLMRLDGGKEERISDVKVIDINGNIIRDAIATTQVGTDGPARGRTIWTFQFPGGVPQKVGMRIEVNMGVSHVEVPVRIRNLPLPPMPTEG